MKVPLKLCATVASLGPVIGNFTCSACSVSFVFDAITRSRVCFICSDKSGDGGDDFGYLYGGLFFVSDKPGDEGGECACLYLYAGYAGPGGGQTIDLVTVSGSMGQTVRLLFTF